MIYNPFQKSQLDICVKSIQVVTRSKWQDSTGVTGVAGGKKSLTCLPDCQSTEHWLYTALVSPTLTMSVFFVNICQTLITEGSWQLQ